MVLLTTISANLNAQILDKLKDRIPQKPKIGKVDGNILKTERAWNRLNGLQVFNKGKATVSLSFDSTTVVGDTLLNGHIGTTPVSIKVDKGRKVTTLSLQRENAYSLNFSTKSIPGQGEKDSVRVEGSWAPNAFDVDSCFLYFTADSTAQTKGQKLAKDAGDKAKARFNEGKKLASDGLKALGVTGVISDKKMLSVDSLYFGGGWNQILEVKRTSKKMKKTRTYRLTAEDGTIYGLKLKKSGEAEVTWERNGELFKVLVKFSPVEDGQSTGSITAASRKRGDEVHNFEDLLFLSLSFK